MDFYSTRILMICLVDTGRPRKKNLLDDLVIVFRAKNREHAFERAVELGKQKETTYLNDRKEKVRWRLAEIVNVDWIGPKVDGKEVASRLHYRVGKNGASPKRQFQPGKSKPEGSF